MTIAFVFPGQGSQSIGMLGELSQHFPQVRDTFAEATEILGYDLWKLVQEGPEDSLNRTQHTQPAMLAAGVSMWRVWLEKKGKLPGVLAGHSLGEYTALVCAGILHFSDAINIVAQRGELMQAAVPAGEGAMAAIMGLSNPEVEQICEEAGQGDIVTPANFNAPSQIVIAGKRVAVQRALEIADRMGATMAKELAVSVPAHCPLMQPAAEKLSSILKKVRFELPQIPVVNNVDVIAETAPDAIRTALTRQLYSPVRWVDTVNVLKQQFGASTIVECGPGRVLMKLNKRINSEVKNLSIHDSNSLEQVLSDV